MVSIRAVIFVLLQYLTAPQSSFFSYSNINYGGAWKIPSLDAVIVCLPRPFIKRGGWERVSFERGNEKTEKLQGEESREGKLSLDNVSRVKLEVQS